MFDRPQNWQAMLQWLWEYGDKYEIARSIPRLDPRRMHTLVNGKDSANEVDEMDTGSLAESRVEEVHDVSIRTARRALAIGGTGEGTYNLLLAFDIFKPLLHWDKSSTWHADVGYEKWHILLLVCSPVIPAVGIITEHLLSYPHSAVSVFSLVDVRAPLTSTPSTSSSIHCR